MLSRLLQLGSATLARLTRQGRPADGLLLDLTPADRLRYPELGASLTPRAVTAILDTANAGDPREQAKLAIELEERDWTLASLLATRRGALTAAPWRLAPADDSAAATRYAETVEAVLRGAQGEDGETELLTFPELLQALLTAYLPGYALAETRWAEGGRTILGWQFIEPYHLSFVDSRTPLLVTDDSLNGRPLSAFGPAKFVWHRHRARSGDPTRGGLIRPVAYLASFRRLNTGDWLRYLEKYGMPFLLARIDDATWQTERAKIASLVRSFGTDGGAVFTKGVELETVAPTNRPAQAYKEFIDHSENALAKLILGQTSTSSAEDSNRSTAAVHNLVRMDLLAADAAALSATLNRYLVQPILRYHHGEQALPLAPRFTFDVDAAADLEMEANILATLKTAGYQADVAEVSAKFGYTLTLVPPAQGGSGLSAATMVAAALPPPAPLPPAASPLPPAASPLPPAASRSDATITALVEAGAAQLAADDAAILIRWLGPLQQRLTALADLPDADLPAALARLPAELPGLYAQMDSGPLQELLEQLILTARARGAADQAAQLAAQEARQ